MTDNEFVREEYAALRREVLSRQWRAFFTVILGLAGVPALALVGANGPNHLWLVLPFVVLIAIILYLAELNAMMRAGRYIRERIEPLFDGAPGWEGWLESRGEFRLMEKHFSACFILIFFAYYFLAIGIAISRLLSDAADDPSGMYNYLLYGGIVAYSVASLWAVSTMLHHWRSSLSTSAKD